MPFSAANKARTRTVLWGSVAYIALAALACAIAVACGSSTSGGGPGPTGTGTGFTGTKDAAGTTETDGGSIGNLLGDGSLPPDDGGVFEDAFTLPENFVPTELGGYALGPPIGANGVDDGGTVQSGNSNCSLVVGVVRDFLSYGLQDGGDPDFEHFSGTAPTLGLVMKPLGSDLKPVYGNECDIANGFSNVTTCPFGQEMTSATDFSWWYRYTPTINDPYLVYLEFVPNNGVYTFESTAYFPLDNAGFGNTPGFAHNFSFTTELHLKFTYHGGETFSFTGDDDVWVFINNALAIDLGGLHTSVNGSVSLDTLGLTKGTEYPLDLFNAERHSTGSDFRADTDLAFTSCGTVPPDVPK
jgi:fibro-slime domain-containing protein